MAIKAAKLRGVESFGMLCSAKELGVDPDASGLLELPADAPVGAPLAGYLGLPDATLRTQADARTAPTASACAASPSTSPPRSGSEVDALEIRAGGRAERRAGSTIELDAGADARAIAAA